MMKGTFQRLRWWFGSPPGISGRVLLEFLRWPITVAGFVAMMYAGTLLVIAWRSNLTLDLAFSAGQVFTGLAGIGAAVVAVAGIAKQLERPRAILTVASMKHLDPGSTFVGLRNVGNENAYGVSLRIDAVAPISVYASERWRHIWSDSPSMWVYRLDDPLVPNGQDGFTFMGEPTSIVAWASNAERVQWLPSPTADPRPAPPP